MIFVWDAVKHKALANIQLQGRVRCRCIDMLETPSAAAVAVGTCDGSVLVLALEWDTECRIRPKIRWRDSAEAIEDIKYRFVRVRGFNFCVLPRAPHYTSSSRIICFHDAKVYDLIIMIPPSFDLIFLPAPPFRIQIN